jgi:outer membrane protein assembly factor BamB
MRTLILSVFGVMALTAIAQTQPSLLITPDTLKFGYVSVDGSHERRLVFKNVGDQTLIIDSILTAGIIQMPSVANDSINAGDSLIFYPRFAPVAEGDFSDLWKIYSNDIIYPRHDLNVVATCVRAFLPGEAIWTYQHIEDVVCVAAAEDIDNDGFPDIWAEGFGSGAIGDNLVCLSGSGDGNIPNVIWTTQPQGGPSNSGGYGDDCLSAATDMNGDGYQDLLFGAAWGNRTVFAISGKNGQTIWSYDTYQNPPSGWIYSVKQTSDNNGDGIPEVLAAAGSDANAVYELDGATGQLNWQYTADDAVMSVVSLADINADGKNEAAFGGADYGTHAYCISGASQGAGTPLWMFTMGTSTMSTSTIEDINNDGYRDVLCGTWNNSDYVYAFNGHRFGQGQMLWRVAVGQLIMRVINCPDLNRDGHEDILVSSWANYGLALDGTNGAELWRGYSGGDVWAIDYTADLTGDTIPEVVYGSFDGNVYCVNGATGEQLWAFNCGYKIFSLRGIGDVNGDGFADVIAGTQFLNNQGGKVYIISGGSSRSAIENQTATIPDNYLMVNSYPNPFNAQTTFKFNMRRSSEYKLSLYDITGKLVKQFSGIGDVGPNSLQWDTSSNKGIASGIYLYRLSADGAIGKGKVTLLK